MATVRVLDLAKEYGLSSKEMLEKVQEMKIPAKSHASPLSEDHIQKIREVMGDPTKEAESGEEGSAQKQPTKEELEAQERQEEEERARREAVEKERAAREAERAEREAEAAEKAAEARSGSGRVKTEPSPFAGLASQIEDARIRAEREAAERAARARAEATAKDVAKKQQVEAALRQRGSKKTGKTTEQAPVVEKRPAPTPSSKKGSGFSSLLKYSSSKKTVTSITVPSAGEYNKEVSVLTVRSGLRKKYAK